MKILMPLHFPNEKLKNSLKRDLEGLERNQRGIRDFCAEKRDYRDFMCWKNKNGMHIFIDASPC